MAIPQPSCLRGALGRSTVRRVGTGIRTTSLRTLGRRTYASGHGEAKKSSDLPWMIGSLAVTVPAATWLYQQGPTKSDHGHEHHEEAHEEKSEDQGKDEGAEEQQSDASKEESQDDKQEESKDNSKEEGESKDSDSDSEAGKDTPQTSDDEQYDKPSTGAPDQINHNPRKGPGELQKGERKPTERKGEKDAAHDYSGANNPHIDSPEKSRKSEGPIDTAKIHGTVNKMRDPDKDELSK